ncbi:MAG TPA: flagellar export protein FliJ [Opitutaceae bacterium]|nr:flagellar export protein FliJ [Opitutaceae bacterium]
MKRFRFPLRPVSRLRAHYELRAREAFAAAVGVCAESEKKLVRASARVVALEAAVLAGRQTLFSAAGEAQNLGAYREELSVEAVAAKEKLAAQAALDQKRREYIDAHRRAEVMRRLEEKARAEHQLELNREEQAEFDDIAGQRAARKTISKS